jgi:GT2 family glycosyltransferase
MIISAVIPTKNRPHDLLLAVRSIVNQKRIPDQLVIIDQSEDDFTKSLIESEFDCKSSYGLCYIKDTSIKGLVEAKSKSLEYVEGDIICFFEDDIIVEEDYLLQIEKTFEENSRLIGCSGIITNASSNGRFYRIIYKIFHRGIFIDPRPDIYANIDNSNHELVKTNVINGGLSAWRKSIFEDIKFDYYNKFHMMEDFEYSFRVNHLFPDALYINPKARLVHNFSPLNRDNKILSFEKKIFEYIVFYKKNKDYPRSSVDLYILLTGILFDAIALSLKLISLAPFIAYFRGVKNGFKHKLMKAANTKINA